MLFYCIDLTCEACMLNLCWYDNGKLKLYMLNKFARVCLQALCINIILQGMLQKIGPIGLFVFYHLCCIALALNEGVGSINRWKKCRCSYKSGTKQKGAKSYVVDKKMRKIKRKLTRDSVGSQ